MLDILRALNGTSVPGFLMGLGGLLLLLSWIDRRAVATIGSVLLILGVGISVAPRVARSPGQATADSGLPDSAPHGAAQVDAPRRNPTQSRGPVFADHVSSDPIKRAAVETDDAASGCTTRFTVLRPEETVLSSNRDKEPSYGGFLGSLMPSLGLLPCATRRFKSRPLTPRSVSEGSVRPEASARRILANGGFAGLERTYGSKCPRAIGKGEIPLASVRVLRFDTLEVARAWASLPWDPDAGAVRASQEAARRTAWFKRPCGDAPAAVFWQEDRAGNVFVAITIYTSPDSLEDGAVVNYAQMLANDMLAEIMPQGTDP